MKLFTLGTIVRELIPYDVPIIYISADSKNLKEFNRLEQTNTYFLQKPLIEENLVSILESCEKDL